MNITGNTLAIDIDNENPNNFSIDALSYQDLLNSLPMSLISAPSTESSMETNDLPFMISDKTVDIDKLPDNILDGTDLASPLNQLASSFESLEAMTQTDLNIFKGKIEEATQTESDTVGNIIEKNSQTGINFIGNKFLEGSTQTDSSFVGNKVEDTSQTESSILKDNLSKRKLKKLLQSKRQEIRILKNRVQQNIVTTVEDVTLEQYELLTEKFFPKETSDFIKIQAQLFKKKTSDRKYTLDFKKQCLSLFLSGPRTYKNLQKIFCLPGIRDLQTLKF